MSSLIPPLIPNKAYDDLYNKPFRYKIEIFDPLETKRLYISDGFDIPQSNLVVTRINLNQAQWDTWDASILIDDSIFNSIDEEILDNGTVMKISLGKTTSLAEQVFYGIIDNAGPIRPNYGKLLFEVDAKGFGVIPTYTLVDFQKVPPPETLETGANRLTNAAAIPFYANNLVRNLCTKLDIIPLLDKTLSERMGPNFGIDSIVDTVKDFIPGIKAPLVTASQVLTIIARMSGAIWYVDEFKKLQFRYPIGDNSGHIIKDYYLEDDSGDYTSYVRSGSTFGYKNSTRPEDGFANQLLTIAEKTDIVALNNRAISFTSTFNKDIAFAVKVDVLKLRNMTFIMSKTGAGNNDTNPAISKLYGCIVADNNKQPTGKVIDYFTIKIADITDQPTPIIKIDRPSIPDSYIDKLVWVVIFAKGNNENNCCRIWHDDNTVLASTEDNPRYSAINPNKGRTAYEFDPDGWFVFPRGPAYSIAFATTQNIPVEASDDVSIQKWSPGRPVQARVTVPALKSLDSTRAYLRELVIQTGQKIRNYTAVDCTIPNILMKPGTEVQVASDKIRDLAFQNNRTATITNISYGLDVSNFSIGSKYCSVGLRGYVSAYSV